MKKLLNIVLWSLIGIAMIAVAIFVHRSYKHSVCSELVIEINHGDCEPLFGQPEIYDIVMQIEDSVVGNELGDIELAAIKDSILNYPYVKSVEVYTTIMGKLKIETWQREPILRVVNNLNNSFYIAQDGGIMPWQQGYPARLLVASGYISDKITRKVLNDPIVLRNFSVNDSLTVLTHLFDFTNYLIKDEFLKAQIEQVYVNNKSELELVPKVGKHLIIFGPPENIPEKFMKLKAFYKQSMNKAGWDTYETINLNFRDQVVCTKK
ncbi:MAG: hypothetical protein JEZ03_06235 [Bacteroidales bacterium]|nr:hypothetical protein [Bacteroidales bacterium]